MFVDIFKLTQSIGRVMHSKFRNEFLNLAMDSEDVVQEGYLFYLDFKKRYEKKFREEIYWSAVKQYITWKILQLIYNQRKKNVSFISLDIKLNEENINDYDNEIFKALLKNSNKKLLPFKNDKDLIEIILKNNNSLFINLKEILGDRDYKIFMQILNKEDTLEKIGEGINMTKQGVSRIYKRSLKKIKSNME